MTDCVCLSLLSNDVKACQRQRKKVTSDSKLFFTSMFPLCPNLNDMEICSVRACQEDGASKQFTGIYMSFHLRASAEPHCHKPRPKAYDVQSNNFGFDLISQVHTLWPLTVHSLLNGAWKRVTPKWEFISRARILCITDFVHFLRRPNESTV